MAKFAHSFKYTTVIVVLENNETQKQPGQLKLFLFPFRWPNKDSWCLRHKPGQTCLEYKNSYSVARYIKILIN